ncbi:Na+/H+ antiporter subunit G [Arenibacterium sp. CAU 1754]
MDMFADIAIAVFLVISGFFGFVGSFGLIKLGDPMSRLHAPTKATTLGVGGVLVASVVHAFVVEGNPSVHELLITLFLFLTAPITALFIAKAHIHRHIPSEELPKPDGDAMWAVLNKPENPMPPEQD